MDGLEGRQNLVMICAGGRIFDVDAVVFDKDGTLVDFDVIWGVRTGQWARRLAEGARGQGASLQGASGQGASGQVASLQGAGLQGAGGQGDVGRLEADLCRAVGYDRERGVVVPDGPVAVASMGDIYAIGASVLFQHGIEWHEGYPLAMQAAEGTLARPPAADEVRARGDVAGVMQRLAAAGLAIGVATNDERALTATALAALGVAEMVGAMVCGDDALLPKPDPAGLQWLAAELGTTTDRMAMVGDSGTDMLAGRNAGVAACIGVSGGAGKRETLARLADVVVGSVDEITVEVG